MRNKKSKKANLEPKRNLFFLVGLVLALAAVLLAFEWKSHKLIEVMPLGNTNFVPDEFVYIPPTPNEKKEIPKQVVKVPYLEIVKNHVDTDKSLDLIGTDPEDEMPLNLDDLIYRPGDNKNDKEEIIHIIVDEMPEFPGGEKALINYLSKQVHYPVVAQENGIQGKVFVSFVIDEKGNVTNVSLVRCVDVSLDNEALRVVRAMPNWKPGVQRGKAVKVKYTVPIHFELQ